MRYLITGGAGFIGSHLVDGLTERRDHVLVLDDLSTGRLENLLLAQETGRVEFVEGSTSDAALVEDMVAEVDAVYHLASAVGVQLIVDRALNSLLQNVHGVENVLASAARHRKRVVYASTSEIYGKHSVGALAEDSDRLLGPPQLSRWNYAIAKAFGESLAFSLYRETGAEAVVVRLFNTTGPRQTGAYGMVLPRFVQQAVEGRNLTVYGDGTQSRCFAHVQDTIGALLMLSCVDGAVGNVYNVGSSQEISILELAERVIERSRQDVSISFVPFDEAYGDGFEELGRRKPDTSAVRELTGWEARLTLDEIVDDTLDYERVGNGSCPGSHQLGDVQLAAAQRDAR